MQARLGFAVAVHIDPEILILDEVLSVGDSLFQRKCYAKMEEFFNGGKTILYVSHDANSINELCSRAVLIADGEVLLESDPKTVITYYQKYLFSKNKDESIIKNEIKKLQIRNNRDKIINNLQESKDEKGKELRAFFVKNYKPVSTVENANYDVKIYDVRISEVGGSSLVNHLIKNEQYELAFSIKFNESAKFVKFGCQIKNKKGFIICGYTLPGREKPVGFVKAAEAFEVKFGFTCNLSIGEYFIDIGVTSDINDEKIYLNMIHDVLCFKVLSCGDDSWGQTNLWSENNCSAKLIA